MLMRRAEQPDQPVTLSDGGEVFMAMAETFFAVRFGMLRDRFGTSWMILALRPQTAA
jgi:PhnB protein